MMRVEDADSSMKVGNTKSCSNLYGDSGKC